MTRFVPERLAVLHRATDVGEHVALQRPSTYSESRWQDVVHGAGFSSAGERLWTLADSVRPNMALLVAGLNPSPASADSGVGFARPGNRFWPAMMAVGLASADRDPQAMLRDHRVGMTDLVKRTTRRADELDAGEYQDGLARVERLVDWLAPRAVCFVGFAGWRLAVDRKAKAGWQGREIGGRPTYVMPSTSGLNASAQLPDLVAHLQIVADRVVDLS